MGRKAMLEVERLEKSIEEYFALCDSINAAASEKSGKKEDKLKKPYSLSGLLCYLEIARSEFERMAKSPRYKKLILRTLLRIEAFTEENALIGALSASAASGSLKYNFGWGRAVEPPEEGTRSIRIVLDEDMMRLAE